MGRYKHISTASLVIDTHRLVHMACLRCGLFDQSLLLMDFAGPFSLSDPVWVCVGVVHRAA